MFSKLTALVAEVVGLSPQQNRPDDFQTHWRAITDCISGAEPVSSVEATDIPHHLEQMVELLCDEDSNTDINSLGTMGPCLEFLLRHKILDTLYIPSKNNYPPGIRQEVLMFLIHLLGRMERPLLPHVGVHQPVQKQIQLCGVDPHSPLAMKEIQFLRTLCLKIHSDPRLADFLLIESRSGHSSYLLTEGLQRLANHTDSLVAMKAYECLLSCVSLPHPGVAQALAVSHLPVLLASKLQYHFQLIPPTCPHTAILGCNVGWGVDYATRGTTADNSPSTYGLWHVEAYLSWLDFYEQAVGGATPPLSEALCVAVRELLLTASLLPKLTKLTEENILLSTAILARSIQFVTDQRLLTEFVSCVLGESGEGGGGGDSVSGEGDVERKGEKEEEGGEAREGKKIVLRDRIIQRIDHPNDEVCQVTLQLFDTLLQCSLPSVLQELVFGWPSGSICVTPSTENSTTSEREDMATERHNLENIVSSYLSLVPAQLLSAEDVTGDTGIEQYLMEAHHQVLKCRLLTQSWNGGGMGRSSIPSSPLSPQASPESPLPSTKPSPLTDTSKTEGQNGGLEGPLVPALLSKLERLLDQSYEVNLLLTSVLSRLSAYSHPLIDQLYSSNGTHQSVFSILRKVSNELQIHAERSPGFQFNLREVRKRMVGQETSDLLSMPHNDLLEGAIVMEEFCKELACIVFAKKSTSLLTLPPLQPPSPITPLT